MAPAALKHMHPVQTLPSIELHIRKKYNFVRIFVWSTELIPSNFSYCAGAGNNGTWIAQVLHGRNTPPATSFP